MTALRPHDETACSACLKIGDDPTVAEWLDAHEEIDIRVLLKAVPETAELAVWEEYDP